MMKRIETGRYQTESAWPGYFIRGDDCILLVGAINKLEDFFRSNPPPRELEPSLVNLIEHRERIKRDVIVHPRPDNSNGGL